MTQNSSDMDIHDHLSSPFKLCPKCKGNKYGVFSVMPLPDTRISVLIRLCANCRFHEQSKLPEIKKKIIYLDQFVLSNLMFVANPKSKKHKKAMEDKYWMQVFEKLLKLIKYNLIICPYSDIHIEESITAAEFNDLQFFQKILANKVAFKHHNLVQDAQVAKHFENYLKGEQDATIFLNEQDCFDMDPNCWYFRAKATDDFRLDFPLTEEGVSSVRKVRDDSHTNLTDHVYDRWREDKKSFDDLVWEEAQDFGKEKLRWFGRYVKYIKKLMEGKALEKMSKPPAVDLFEKLYKIANAHSIGEDKILSTIMDCLNSKTILNVPCVRLSATYFASLARKLKEGGNNPSRGMISDSESLSTFLPYCDAVFTDKENDNLFGREPLKSEKEKFNTNIFSKRNITKFIDFLEDIWSQADNSHMALVKDIYDPNWLTSTVINFDT